MVKNGFMAKGSEHIDMNFSDYRRNLFVLGFMSEVDAGKSKFVYFKGKPYQSLLLPLNGSGIQMFSCGLINNVASVWWTYDNIAIVQLFSDLDTIYIWGNMWST